MQSNILTFLNMDFDVFFIVTCVIMVALVIIIIFLLLDYLKMRKRYNEFMTGESGKSLEYTIYKRFREIDALKEAQKDNDDQIAIIYNKMRNGYSKIGMYRYNAFNVENALSGGNMSFALTMLNDAHDGFLVNTIHNRAGCYVYMKEIKNGEPTMHLSEEEQISLEKALHYGEKQPETTEENE